MPKSPNKSGPRTTSRSVPPPKIETGHHEVASRQVLVELAKKMQSRLMNDGDAKVTFSEYFKILQLLKETEGDLPSDISIRWVDPLWSKVE